MTRMSRSLFESENLRDKDVSFDITALNHVSRRGLSSLTSRWKGGKLEKIGMTNQTVDDID